MAAIWIWGANKLSNHIESDFHLAQFFFIYLYYTNVSS